MKLLFIRPHYWNYVSFDVKCKIINLLNAVVWICPENDSTDFSQKKKRNVFTSYKKSVAFTSSLTISLKKNWKSWQTLEKNLFVRVLKIFIPCHYPVGTTVVFFFCYEWNKTQIAFLFFSSGCMLCDISSTKSPENYITITFDFNNGNYLSSEEESGIEIFCFLNTKMNILFLFNFYFWVRCNWLILLKCGYTKTKTELVVKTESVINEGFQNCRSLIHWHWLQIKKLTKKQQQVNKMKRKREATVIFLSKSSLGSIHYLNDLLSGGPLV